MQSDEQLVVDDVCAVVVTYNRKDLLRECVRALLAQTHALSRILVVDNVSTDGTCEMFDDEFSATQYPQIELLRLPLNVGGAGGFHEGVKRAAQNSTWLWLMDDDTIADESALAELLAGRARFPETIRPDLLASKAVWTDGSMHPMNVPRLKRNDSLESMCVAALQSTLSLRSTSFVSLLIRRDLVARYGLPIADYFIWNDDVEYTARILRREFGVLVPQSVVVHKTPRKRSEPGMKFFYGLRNTFWMVRHSEAWSRGEKLERLGAALKQTADFVLKDFTLVKLRVVGRAILTGLTGKPRR